MFGPGSASDTICRIIADRLGPALGQPVVVEDRPGADGALAAQYVHHAGRRLYAPDGHQFAAVGDPFLHKDVSYDPVKDFTPVSRVGSFALMLVINPSLPFNPVKDLVDYAKANPGKLSSASGNTAGIVGGKTLAHWAGIDLLHVPYKSFAAGHGGHDRRPRLHDVRRFHRRHAACAGGPVRALAITRLKRSPLFPDLPTMDEAGIEGFDLDAWAGLVAPAGTPPAVVAKLNAALRPSSTARMFRRNSRMSASRAFPSTPGEFGDYIKVQLGKWQKMVKDANIQAE